MSAMVTSEPAFRFTINKGSERLFEIRYSGYMTADDAHLRATEMQVRAAGCPVGLYYDVSGFTGFHRSQVTKHAELFSGLGRSVTGIAIVGARAVIRFGAISVGLLSSVPIRTFDHKPEALAWLENPI